MATVYPLTASPRIHWGRCGPLIHSSDTLPFQICLRGRDLLHAGTRGDGPESSNSKDTQVHIQKRIGEKGGRFNRTPCTSTCSFLTIDVHNQKHNVQKNVQNVQSRPKSRNSGPSRAGSVDSERDRSWSPRHECWKACTRKPSSLEHISKKKFQKRIHQSVASAAYRQQQQSQSMFIRGEIPLHLE